MRNVHTLMFGFIDPGINYPILFTKTMLIKKNKKLTEINLSGEKVAVLKYSISLFQIQRLKIQWLKHL